MKFQELEGFIFENDVNTGPRLSGNLVFLETMAAAYNACNICKCSGAYIGCLTWPISLDILRPGKKTWSVSMEATWERETKVKTPGCHV